MVLGLMVFRLCSTHRLFVMGLTGNVFILGNKHSFEKISAIFWLDMAQQKKLIFYLDDQEMTDLTKTSYFLYTKCIETSRFKLSLDDKGPQNFSFYSSLTHRGKNVWKKVKLIKTRMCTEILIWWPSKSFYKGRLVCFIYIWIYSTVFLWVMF